MVRRSRLSEVPLPETSSENSSFHYSGKIESFSSNRKGPFQGHRGREIQKTTMCDIALTGVRCWPQRGAQPLQTTRAPGIPRRSLVPPNYAIAAKEVRAGCQPLPWLVSRDIA
jgi:hypothetical protein